jgi:hypothetical protein
MRRDSQKVGAIALEVPADNRTMTSSQPVPKVTPVGKVHFPASNAHALVVGGPIASVRARMKVSSLLYDGCSWRLGK